MKKEFVDSVGENREVCNCIEFEFGTAYSYQCNILVYSVDYFQVSSYTYSAVSITVFFKDGCGILVLHTGSLAVVGPNQPHL